MKLQNIYEAPNGVFGIAKYEVCPMPHTYRYQIVYLPSPSNVVLFDNDDFEQPRVYMTHEDALRDLESISSHWFDKVLKNRIYVK